VFRDHGSTSNPTTTMARKKGPQLVTKVGRLGRSFESALYAVRRTGANDSALFQF
jgi:hypothetical protein